MGTYQKTKVIQSYLMMWASYDPIELGPSKPKNGGYMVPKELNFWPKSAFFGPNRANLGRHMADILIF